MAGKRQVKKKSTVHKQAVQRSEKAKQAKKPALLTPDSRSIHVEPHDLPSPLPLQRLMTSRGLQPKLRVTAANDRYEQEADAVASQVVDRLAASQAPAPQKPAQRQQEEEEPIQAKPLAATISRVQRQEEEELQAQRVQRQEEEEEPLQAQRLQRQEQPEEEELQAKRSTPIGREGGELDAGTAAALEAARGGGQRMPGDVRGPMEQAFGADFDSVRLHTGSQAHQLNRAISAKAFTTGSDIFFRQGAYEPHNRGGQELLAHELAHVVQQGNAPARTYDVQREDEEDNSKPVPPPVPDRSKKPRLTGKTPPPVPDRSKKPRLTGKTPPPVPDRSKKPRLTGKTPPPVPDRSKKPRLTGKTPPPVPDRSTKPTRESKSVEGSESSVEKFKLQELSYTGFAFFLRQVLGLNDPTAVASLSASFTFEIGVSAGVPQVLGASITPYIKLAGTMSVSDLRSLSVGATLEFGASSKLDIAKLWEVHAKIGMQIGINASFEDEKHLAAYLISRIAALLKGFKRVIFGRAKDRKKQLTAEEIKAIQQLGLPEGGEGYEELSQKGVSGTSASVGLTSEVGTDIAKAVGVTVGTTGTRTTYYKRNDKNQRVKRVGTSWVSTFKLNLRIPGAGFGCEIVATRTVKKKVGNSDSLNIKVIPKIPLGQPILQQIILNAPTVLSGKNFKDGAQRFLRALFDPVNLAVLAGGIGASSAALEFNLVSSVPADKNKLFLKQLKDGDYTLQYARLSKSFQQKFSFKQDIPTGYGVNVALGETVEMSRSVGVGEFLGSRTLGYIQVVYNGLLNRGRRGQSQWEQYRDQHESQIHKMFIAVADPSSPAAAEAKKLDTGPLQNELKPDIISRANKFVSLCESLLSPDKVRKLDLQKPSDQAQLKRWQEQIMPYFEAYLAAARLGGQKADAQTWRRTSSGSVRASVMGNNGPPKPELQQVRYDRRNKDDVDDKFPQSLRESYEEGFRHRITFMGYHLDKNRQVELRVNFQKPDEATEKFVKLVYARSLHKYANFPFGLAVLDDGFKNHALQTEKQYDTFFQKHKANNRSDRKAKAEATKEQQQFWERNLQKHLTEIMDKTLDAPLQRKS